MSILLSDCRFWAGSGARAAEDFPPKICATPRPSARHLSVAQGVVVSRRIPPGPSVSRSGRFCATLWRSARHLSVAQQGVVSRRFSLGRAGRGNAAATAPDRKTGNRESRGAIRPFGLCLGAPESVCEHLCELFAGDGFENRRGLSQHRLVTACVPFALPQGCARTHYGMR